MFVYRYVLDGFPMTRKQVDLMHARGILPVSIQHLCRYMCIYVTCACVQVRAGRFPDDTQAGGSDARPGDPACAHHQPGAGQQGRHGQGRQGPPGAHQVTNTIFICVFFLFISFLHGLNTPRIILLDKRIANCCGHVPSRPCISIFGKHLFAESTCIFPDP